MNAVTRINWLLRSAWLVRVVAQCLKSWKLLVVILYATLETVPHLRVQDMYGSYPSRYQNYRTCLYLGNRGVVEDDGIAGHGCPLLVLMNPTFKRKFYE